MLFSPVLHFLGGNTNGSPSSNSGLPSTRIDFDADGDVCMSNNDSNSNSHSNASSPTTSPPDDKLQPQPQERDDHDPQNLSEMNALSSALQQAPSVDTAGDYDPDEDEFNPYLFIKQLPPYHLLNTPWSMKHNLSRLMPWTVPHKSRNDPPITLVLDLDETLVHCTVDAITDADICFPVFFGGMEYNVHVRLRPHLAGFLQRISQHFEVIVFTASQKVYANELLNRIDPQGQYIRHRMYRESCLPVEGNYLKDLNVLTGPTRSLEQMVLVDNSPHAFGYQIDNGIPIESWFDDRNDTELLKLEAFLLTLVGSKDVRPLLREKFQTFQLVKEA